MRSMSEATMTDIISFVDRFYEKNGYTPTIAAIAGGLSLAVGTVHKYLRRMEENGTIARAGRHIVTPGIAARQGKTAPMAGEIACGAPIWIEEARDAALPLPSDVSGGAEHFWLRAHGRSMENAGIDDGDFVLIRRQASADPGQIVAALIGDEATLKTFLPDPKRHKIILRAENDDRNAYPDQIYDAILIRGVAVYVLKPL